MRAPLRALLPLAALLLLPATGLAATITLTFSGTVTSVNQLLLEGTFAVGDGFSGMLQFDSTAVDGDPSTTFASYDGATNFNFDVAGDVVSAPLGFIEVGDDEGSPAFDSFRAAVICETGTPCSGPSPGGLVLSAIELALSDSTASVFSDDSLPTALSLAEFDEAFASLQFSGDTASGLVNVTITALSMSVPEPGVAALLGLAGALAAARRSR